MAIPTHGPFCQTLLYPVNCRDCGAPIRVLQCTCGSAVLFDTAAPHWDKHDCAGYSATAGVAVGRLKGWAAVDVLRNQGVPISADIMERISPGRARGEASQTQWDLRRAEPRQGQSLSILALVREVTGAGPEASPAGGPGSLARRHVA